MKAFRLFKKIEDVIPSSLALKNDKIGFLGNKKELADDINKVLVLMDYVPPDKIKLKYEDYDLLILHHPPLNSTESKESLKLELPTYVIHSNWDIILGGACDALANSLNIEVTGILDPATGLGRLGKLKSGPQTIDEFSEAVANALHLRELRIVNEDDYPVEKIAVLSGFGLNPGFISKAHSRGVDLYVSGDLTHKGAILAKTLGIRLIDATHHATEIPGIYRLGELIESWGLQVQVLDSKLPWKTHFYE